MIKKECLVITSTISDSGDTDWGGVYWAKMHVVVIIIIVVVLLLLSLLNNTLPRQEILK